MLDTREDEYGTPIDPPADDWNPGGPGPWPPDYEDHNGPWAPAPEQPMVPGVNQPLPPGNPTPPPPGPGGGGGFTGSFNAPDRMAYPSLPTVPNAPIPNLPAFAQAPAFSYDPYTAPTPFKSPSVDDMLIDPSYNWRKAQGEESLQRWAAARGTLNDSGTAKSLLEYGGNAASQEYANIWNRDYNAYNTNEANRAKTYDTNRAGAVQQYNTNYQTQYVDPYKAAYQTAIDTWIPQQETWRAGVDMSRLGYTTQSGQVMHDNDMNYANAWNSFLFDYNKWKNGPLDDQTYGYGMA